MAAKARKEGNMTPTRSAKNFSPIMQYGKYAGVQNAASPKHLRVTNRQQPGPVMPPNTILQTLQAQQIHNDAKAAEKATNSIAKRASQAVMASNANNTMSSLGVNNQQPVQQFTKERKSIDVTKKTNMLSNLIYKPFDASALATKA